MSREQAEGVTGRHSSLDLSTPTIQQARAEFRLEFNDAKIYFYSTLTHVLCCDFSTELETVRGCVRRSEVNLAKAWKIQKHFFISQCCYLQTLKAKMSH